MFAAAQPVPNTEADQCFASAADTVRGPFRLNLTIGRDLSHRLRLAEITGLDKEDSSSPTRKRKGSFLDHVFGGDDDKPDPLLVTDIMFLEKDVWLNCLRKQCCIWEGSYPASPRR